MAIGVFDSGLGGLTVLERLASSMPNQRFVYFGDNARAPYGERSAEEVIAFTREGVETLFSAGCDLAVIACNTASAIALRPLQQGWLPRSDRPERRVLGVFVPIVEAITARPWRAPRWAGPQQSAPGQALGPRRIAFFATKATVASGAFEREVAARIPDQQVISEACPGLAGAIERGALAEADAIAAAAVARALARADEAPEVAVLGCTHYPLVAAAFRKALPPETAIFSQPDIVAVSLARYLERHSRFEGELGAVRFLTSGDPAAVTPVAQRFWSAHAVGPIAFERAGAPERLGPPERR